jgi:hypothetical protein
LADLVAEKKSNPSEREHRMNESLQHPMKPTRVSIAAMDMAYRARESAKRGCSEYPFSLFFEQPLVVVY